MLCYNSYIKKTEATGMDSSVLQQLNSNVLPVTARLVSVRRRILSAMPSAHRQSTTIPNMIQT